MGDSPNAMYNDNKFKLGIFSPNCSGGMAITNVPERWDASWENNVKIAQLADEAGIEFMLPIARWLGYGGETNFQRHVLETITWSTGLLALTKHITAFATTHTAFFHPIVAAKQFATVDHISAGRFGVNVVCGWNKPEYDMFNIQLPNDHATRYGMGEEWLNVVKKVWREREPFDWEGEFFTVKGVQGHPKPLYDRPPIMNAGSSDEGKAFATRNVDFLFTVLIDLDKAPSEVKAVKDQARANGRDLGVFTTSYVVCRPTQAEADDYHHYYANENADWVAVDRLMTLQGLHAKSFPPEAFKLFRERFAGGHGVYPLVGDPDSIANTMARMAEAGYAGTTISFVDYAKEFPYFRDEVLPRLEAKGLRQPFRP